VRRRGAARLAGAAALAASAAAACLTAPHAGAGPEGCWYFERDAAAEALQLPWGVRLLADTLSGFPAIQQQPGVRRAQTLLGWTESAGHPFGYWRPVGADSLEIGYPAGGGLLLRVAAGAERATGTARPVGDILRPDGAPLPGEQRVALVRAACP
jgi:hypothetical protein